MGGNPTTVLDRIAPKVRDYSTAKFALADDLARLERVLAAGAPEAVVLYGARILEALAGEALRRLKQEPSPNVFSNLEVLDDLSQVGTATRYWAHALRRLGNLVRHVEAHVESEHGSLAALFAEGWLKWFFCSFCYRDHLPALTRDGGPLGLGAAAELSAVMHALEEFEAAGPDPPPGRRPPAPEGHPAFGRTPVMAAVLAETLLSWKKTADARRALGAALGRSPHDLRLRQLMGLAWSREPASDLRKALGYLEPLAAEFPHDDETVGITAGVYKRLWRANPADDFPLAQAHRAYRDAWKDSGRKNRYLGINAATTALLLGRADEARRLAGEVEALLNRRAATLPAELRAANLLFNYWDQVTLAEARLLRGDWAGARELYEDAFRRHPGRAGDVEVTRQQRDEILAKLGLPPMGP